MAIPQHPIVVGIDGSEPSLEAASWAAVEARRRHTVLHLVIAGDPSQADHADQTVRSVATRCRRMSPDLEVTEESVVGHPVDALVRRSAEAQMVVVGSRGHGGFVNALLGSVSASVANHSSCPVVVVRGNTATATGPVVVGLDDSPGSRAALHFAFEAASTRSTELVALQAFPDAYFVPGPLPHPDREEIQQQADRYLAQQLANWSDRYPEVPLRKIAQNYHPVAALRDAARDAQLLVIGHTGRGGFVGLLLGSVAAGVLHHAPCPVAVVRTGKQGNSNSET